MEQEFGYEVQFVVEVECEGGAVTSVDGEARVPEGSWTLQEAIQEAKSVVRRRFENHEWVWDLTIGFRGVRLTCASGEVRGVLILRGGVPRGRNEPDRGFAEFVRINRLLGEDPIFGEKATLLNAL